MAHELDDKLIDAAKVACQKSYSPYSKFRVGCAILTQKGQIFTGCNIENLSFGLTICAERSAVCNAMSTVGPKLKIKQVIIYTPTDIPVTPCGACRQVLSEFGNDISITCVSKTSSIFHFSLNELLPVPAKINLKSK